MLRLTRSSGAAYAGVPPSDVCVIVSKPTTRASPRSQTRTATYNDASSEGRCRCNGIYSKNERARGML